jgi:ligand-binding SRPBCC domain-containing protein
MIDVITEIIIHANTEEVAAFAADPGNAPQWYINIKAVEWQTSKPLQQGSRIAFKAKFLGRELSYVYEITEFVPGEKLVMQTADGPFPMKTTYAWQKINNTTTKMTLRNQGNPSGFSKWITPFMRAAMKRANKKDLKLLKSILEKNHHPKKIK